MASPDSAALAGTYSSPSGQQQFHQPLGASNGPATSTTDYLVAMRNAAAELQNSINVFLTQKMEQDQQAQTANGTAPPSNLDEAKEEENYGEEVDDDDTAAATS